MLTTGAYIRSPDENMNADLTAQTDGADTIYVNNITFRNWVVDNGDDSISMKANSTNVLIEDCDFYTGLGIAIGSIGQYSRCIHHSGRSYRHGGNNKRRQRL